jgi:hypothetical protein
MFLRVSAPFLVSPRAVAHLQARHRAGLPRRKECWAINPVPIEAEDEETRHGLRQIRNTGAGD